MKELLNDPETNLAVLTGTMAAVAAAVQALVIALPPDSPVRTKLQAMRDQQADAMRAQGHSELVLFSLERAWQSMLPE